jgi:diadenosine tetraphosphatase ApaH/serine/threonine PP2A family protein phosphatase
VNGTIITQEGHRDQKFPYDQKKLLAGVGLHTLLCGHVHIQYRRSVAGHDVINPGSVGQPRDGDPRAAYAIVDTALQRVELYRTSYAVEDAQNKVVKAGLPDVLAQRLAVGR